MVQRLQRVYNIYFYCRRSYGLYVFRIELILFFCFVLLATIECWIACKWKSCSFVPYNSIYNTQCDLISHLLILSNVKFRYIEYDYPGLVYLQWIKIRLIFFPLFVACSAYNFNCELSIRSSCRNEAAVVLCGRHYSHAKFIVCIFISTQFIFG